MNNLNRMEKVKVRNQLGDDKLLKRIEYVVFKMTTELERICEDASFMQEDLHRVLLAGGKRLRPILAYLSYCMAIEEGANSSLDNKSYDNEKIIPLMSMLELMHTTSLIHDDVVDGSDKRRGVKTINKTSGNDSAVKSGDFLLAKAMEKLKNYRGTGINEELADISAEMCRGELNQLLLRNNINEQNEYNYYLCIKRKTAGLIAGSCYCGALAAGMPKEDALALKYFGERFGMAFQIRDDIQDYTSEESTGKNGGQDIKNGILTLPVLLAKSEMNEELTAILEKNDKSKQEELLVKDFVRNSNAITQAEAKTKTLCGEAIAFLDSYQDSSYKNALIKMVNTFAII